MKCSAFWNHTNIRSGNRIYPCCRFKTSIGQFDGDVGNVLHIPEYKKIREANAKGEFIKGCEKCWYEEKIGHKSLRQEFNEKYTTDNVELKFEENNEDSVNNISDLLHHFYRVFLAQAYITESLPFNVLEFYAVFLNKHLQEADTYDYRHYNIRGTFRNEFKQFIKDKNVFKSESEDT